MEPATILFICISLLLAGAMVGFLAGLFGVGGGGISVPVFFEVFMLLGYPPDIAMPVSVGTSLAVMIPTSLKSAHGHYKMGTLNTKILKIWALPILLGVIFGSVIAKFADAKIFQAVFVFVASINAAKLLIGSSSWRINRTLPKIWPMRIAGFIIGILSSIMGIGGGALTNLFLTLNGLDIKKAISTSAGVGVLIALPGTVGYSLAGYGIEGLPAYNIGFISPFAVILTIPTSVLTAKFGVSLVHRWPKRLLEIIFGLFLIFVALRFIIAIIL